MEGQTRIMGASVLVIGVGGLGSPLAMYLAAAGIGCLIIADDDEVELSNLHRQLLHNEKTLGLGKVESAGRALGALNSGTEVRCVQHRMNTDTLSRYVEQADIVADASDNFETRYTVNRICHRFRKPLVSAAVIRMEGQIYVFTHARGEPCYQCLYPPGSSTDESCVQNGILGPVAGIAGSIQATEVIKLLCGVGRSLSGRMLVFDALNMEWRDMKLRRDPACAVCGDTTNK